LIAALTTAMTMEAISRPIARSQVSNIPWPVAHAQAVDHDLEMRQRSSTGALAGPRASTHFYRSVIRASNEFESQMSHLFASLPARIGDSGY
jgi:hypothetical protein